MSKTSVGREVFNSIEIGTTFTQRELEEMSGLTNRGLNWLIIDLHKNGFIRVHVREKNKAPIYIKCEPEAPKPDIIDAFIYRPL